MKKPDLHIVSFSGGKDSTAMLLHMMELGMQIDIVLYCDTWMEFPAMYRVQVGAFKNKVYADVQLKKVSEAGFDTYMVQIDGFYKIQTGAFSKKENADAMLEKVQAAGFNAFITTKGGQAVSTAAPVVKKEIKVGSTVRLNKGAKTYTGGNLASFVYNRDHKVKEINVDRVVITYNNIVIAAVKKSDLTLVA